MAGLGQSPAVQGTYAAMQVQRFCTTLHDWSARVYSHEGSLMRKRRSTKEDSVCASTARLPLKMDETLPKRRPQKGLKRGRLGGSVGAHKSSEKQAYCSEHACRAHLDLDPQRPYIWAQGQVSRNRRPSGYLSWHLCYVGARSVLAAYANLYIYIYVYDIIARNTQT